MKFLSRILSLFMSSVTLTVVYADTTSFVILDVRTADEFAQSHLSGAQNIDFLKPDFKENIEKLDKNKTYKLYCRSGNRSGQAMAILKSIGFKDIENLGSLKQAATRLNKTCEGRESC